MAGLLAGQPPGRRVERLPVAHQAQRTARRHLHPVGVLQTLDRARPARDTEVGPVAVDDPRHGGGHRGSLPLERGEPQVPGLRQGSEVTAADGIGHALVFLCLGGWLPLTIAVTSAATAQRRWRRDGRGSGPLCRYLGGPRNMKFLLFRLENLTNKASVAMLGVWRAIWAPGAATSTSSRSSARAVAPADPPDARPPHRRTAPGYAL